MYGHGRNWKMPKKISHEKSKKKQNKRVIWLKNSRGTSAKTAYALDGFDLREGESVRRDSDQQSVCPHSGTLLLWGSDALWEDDYGGGEECSQQDKSEFGRVLKRNTENEFFHPENKGERGSQKIFLCIHSFWTSYLNFFYFRKMLTLEKPLKFILEWRKTNFWITDLEFMRYLTSTKRTIDFLFVQKKYFYIQSFKHQRWGA